MIQWQMLRTQVYHCGRRPEGDDKLAFILQKQLQSAKL